MAASMLRRRDRRSTTPTAPDWTFDPPFDGTGLTAVHYALDPKTGTLDLLLRIEAPLADPAAWSRPNVPVIAVVDDGSGSLVRAGFKLLRGQRLEPGASLHLRGRVPIAAAAKAGHVRVGLAAGG